MEKMHQLVMEMPKVELHAHLNGSISDELLTHLKTFAENDNIQNHEEYPSIDSKGVLMDAKASEDLWSDYSNKTRSLDECWQAFRKIHEVIQTPRILYVATVNVIAEFSRDNVIYLELRTGAKQIHSIPSRMAYVEAVVRGIQEGQRKFPILVKLLLSIDRGLGEESAYETLKLAQVLAIKYPNVITGIDVSGDPNKGHWSWIVKVMQEARKTGFKISCHLPEIVNPDEGLEFMKFGPERVGHGQYLHPLFGGTDELWEMAKQMKIPIETCISSNLVSGVTKSLDSHVVRIFQEESVPFVISTDDSGVFRTTLSNEFKKFLTVSQININELYKLSVDSITYAFASTEEKAQVSEQIKKWWSDLIKTT